jgi:hypothetical protein
MAWFSRRCGGYQFKVGTKTVATAIIVLHPLSKESVIIFFMLLLGNLKLF